MSWLSSFMNPGRGYQAAQDQLGQYYGQAQGYLNPYMQQGQQQYGNLNSIIQNLMNPSKLNEEWIKGYKESPQALQAEKMAQQSGLNAASSMGLMGSNTALNALQSGTSQIGLNDRQNYLNDMMNKYMQGAGLSQGIYGSGLGAAGAMGNNAMNMGQNAAEMAYGRQNASGNLMGGLLGTGAELAGSVLGGPIGGAIGGALAKRWNLSGGK